MRLSRLYSNRSDVFPAIDFVPGLNVVIGEIRDPANLGVDTHNLGKTTLGRLLDYCLLLGQDSKFFLWKHPERFESFIFVLEIALDDETFITIARAPATSNVRVQKHANSADLSSHPSDSWTFDVPFSRSKQLVDGLLSLNALGGLEFRIPLGYLVRTQNDYQDVFRLDKHRGADRHWKPALAFMLGLDGDSATKKYDLAEKHDEQAANVRRLVAEIGPLAKETDKILGLTKIKEAQVSAMRDEIESFRFKDIESDVNRELVEGLERKIADLNDERYRRAMAADRIRTSIDPKIRFNPAQATRLFEEAGVNLGTAFVKSHEELVEFFRTVTLERAEYLSLELIEHQNRLSKIEEDLDMLSNEREASLALLRERETFVKYRELTDRLVDRRTELESLLDKRERIAELQGAANTLADIQHQVALSTQTMRSVLDGRPSLYESITGIFTHIIAEVLHRDAVLSTRINKSGNYDFQAEIVDDGGEGTGADEGTTYRKLLCMAFDLALIAGHPDGFPRFCYHDGALEGLDVRKKMNLIRVMKEFAKHGIQQIVTVIDSDLPDIPGGKYAFDADNVVRVLHDLGEDGLLFKMPTW